MDEATALKELSHAVSHDLQAPLRHIQGYLRLLDAAPLDPTQRRHLEGARDNADHLQRMLDALLVLARLDTEPFQAADVALETVAKQAQDGLNSHPRADVPLHIGSLPDLRGDPLRIRRLLEVLLQNSLDHGAHQVHVHGERQGHTVTLVVEDEGPGFPSRLSDRALQIFQTLGADRDHVGAGLAIARRIARQHGGDLHVDAKEGRGVRVTVDLQDTEAHV